MITRLRILLLLCISIVVLIAIAVLISPPLMKVRPLEDPGTPIDKALKKLDWGHIAFNTPPAIEYGETKTIHLLLSPTLSLDELEKRVTEGGPLEGYRIKIANKMEANLIGEAFEISHITPNVQPISIEEPTEWKWDIRPKRTGSQRLHLSLNAIVEVEAKELSRSIRVFDRTISVAVSSRQSAYWWAKDNWEILVGIAAVLGAVCTGIWAVMGRGRV